MTVLRGIRPGAVTAALVLGVLASWPHRARADGAFPDSLAIFLPGDQPDRIVVATNFGLLLSSDDGASWDWVCEDVIGPYAAPYQLGPPPGDRILAVTYAGLSVSADFGCTWTQTLEPFSSVTDVFPDPNDPTRVFALGGMDANGGTPVGILAESSDGGESFGEPLYSTQPGAFFTGVEVARSDPDVLVLAMYGDPPGHAVLLRSDDRGATWDPVDLFDSIDSTIPRILTVAPDDPDTVFLRLQDGSDRDRMGIFHAQTGRVDTTLELDGPMTAFLMRPDGTVIVGVGSDTRAYRSDDGGQSFAPWSTAPHLRALGERDGVLVGVADNFVDGFAVGRSTDDGQSWQGLMSFKDIRAPLGCGPIAQTCATAWDDLVLTFGIEPPEEERPPAEDDGCGCVAAGLPRAGPAPGWLLFAVLGWARRAVLRGTRRGARPAPCRRRRRGSTR